MLHRLHKVFRPGARPRKRGVRLLQSAAASVRFEALESRRLLASPSVTALTLINAASDSSLGTVSNGGSATINLNNTRSINFRADVSAASSVRFGYDGNTSFRTESQSPLAFAGDNGPNDYLDFTPTVGTHTVTARAYAGRGASGAAGAEYRITLNVTDSGANTGGNGGGTTPPAGGQSPFLGAAPSLPAQSILFDNFDNGGEGVAYHDDSPGNMTGQYRTNVGVDIESTTDSAPSGLQSSSGVGRNLGHVRPGEWMAYTVNVAASGTYKLQVRFASRNAGGNAHLDVDGHNASGTISLTGTGGWQTWKTVEKGGITLSAGTHVLRFVVDSTNNNADLGNLHWFRFVADDGATGGGNNGGGSTQPGTLTWPGGWSRTNDAPTVRYEAMGHAFNNKLYVFGGYKDDRFRVDRTYEVYNPSNNTWTQLGTLPAAMAETHITPVDDGKYIYFVGGFKGDLKHGGIEPPQDGSSLVFRWDVANNAWTQLPSLPHIQGAAGTAIVGRKIHIIGGNPADRVTNIGDHFVLDLDSLGAGWTSAKATPDPKDHASAITLNGKIYVFGGEYGHDKLGDTQKSVHVYDPATDNWTRLADMPFRSGHAEASTFVLNGYIVFAGGQTTGQVATNRVAAYNPANNIWTELRALPNYLQGTIVQRFGNKIIVTMGGRYTEQPLKETYIGYI